MNVTDPTTLFLIASWFADIALLGATTFLLSYLFFFNWGSTRAGRAIVAFVSAVVMLTLLSWITRTFGNIPVVYDIIRLIVMVYAAFASWGMVYALYKTWRNTPIDGLNHNEHRTGPLVRRTLTGEEVEQTNQDKILGTIRTAVPAGVAFLLSWLITKIPAVADIIASIDAELAGNPLGLTFQGILTAILIALATAAYYFVSRKLGDRWPGIEKWLLGSAKKPAYFLPADAAVVTGSIPAPADREAVVTAGDSVLVQKDEHHSEQKQV